MPEIARKLPGPRRVLDEIVADCRALGIVGERSLLLALYVIGTSRLLDRPLSAIVQGRSSSGKSYVVSEVARLFPPDQVIHATRMTPQALYHMKNIAHHFVVAGERSRVQDDAGADATAALRQLQSDLRIVKQITVKGESGKFETQTVEVEGPIAYVETTTLNPGTIFPEDLNRALLLGTDETEGQTRAILKRIAGRYKRSDSGDPEAIVTKHRDFQSRLERRAVSISFADRLMETIPAKKVEARRAGQQILSAIEAVTLLHQFDRKPKGDGQLVATAADYEIAAEILRGPLGQSLGVKPSAAHLYDKIAARFKSKVFSTRDVQKLDKATDRAVRNWLTELAEHECIDQVSAAKGPHPATWRLNGRSPEETVLPDPEAIGLKPESGKSRKVTAVPASTRQNREFSASRKAGPGKKRKRGAR